MISVSKIFLAFLALFWLNLPFTISSPMRMDHYNHADDYFDKFLIDTLSSDEAYHDKIDKISQEVMDEITLDELDFDRDKLITDTPSPGVAYHDNIDGPEEVMDDNLLDNLDYYPDELNIDTSSPGETYHDNIDGPGAVMDDNSLDNLDYYPDA